MATAPVTPTAPDALEQQDLSPGIENETPGRRRFLTALAAIAGASLLPPRTAQAQRVVRTPRFPATGPLAPVPRIASSTIAKLVNRITYGASPAEMARAKSMGFLKYLDAQLDPGSLDDGVVELHLDSAYPFLKRTPNELYNENQQLVQRQLTEATFFRAAYSQRQLYERMVEFWTDHFTVYMPKVGYLKVIDDRDVVRKYALGKFPEMLWASAHSAAMLQYLDQPQSRGNSPNQNYAREIMELHTLGVDGGYTQDDVAALSRIFTGWTIRNRGDFFFDPTGHDFTQKVLLGKTYPAMPTSTGAGAISEGEEVIRLLSAHPSTARYIAFKMARYLLQYDPPAALLEATAATYTRTGGDIKAMIRTILTPTNVTAATARYKRPYHYVVSTMRAMNVTTQSITYPAGRALTLVGQAPFMHEEPDGYPESVQFWAGNVLPRWNFATYISNGTTEIPVNITPFLSGTAEGVVNAINVQMFGGEMTATLRAALTAYVGNQASTATRVRETCALAMSAADFMWY